MTKVETIRMAEQAGFVIDKDSKQFQPNCISATHHVIDEPLTRFEALVRADEREACAKVCEAFDDDGGAGEAWALRFAQVVRARGEK